MFSLRFWLFVAVGAVVVFGWKIWSGASERVHGGTHRSGSDRPARPPDRESFHASDRGPTSTEKQPEGESSPSQATDSPVQDTEWFLIATAPDRDVAHDVMEQLSENGVNAGVREQPVHGSYSGGINPARADVPIVVDKSKIERALTVLKNAGFLDDLTIRSG